MQNHGGDALIEHIWKKLQSRQKHVIIIIFYANKLANTLERFKENIKY